MVHFDKGITVLFIRLEQSQNKFAGVYNAFYSVVWDTHHSGVGWVELPSPYCDSGIQRHIDSHEVCCCNSMWQFDQWWPEATLHGLSQVNLWGEGEIDVVILDSRYYASGEYQCVINRTTAVEVERIPMQHFVKLSQKVRAALLKEIDYAGESTRQGSSSTFHQEPGSTRICAARPSRNEGRVAPEVRPDVQARSTGALGPCLVVPQDVWVDSSVRPRYWAAT